MGEDVVGAPVGLAGTTAMAGGLALLLVALLGLLLRLLLGGVTVGLGSGGTVSLGAAALVVVEDLAAGVGTLLVLGVPGKRVLAENALHGVATDVLAVKTALADAGTIAKLVILLNGASSSSVVVSGHRVG